MAEVMLRDMPGYRGLQRHIRHCRLCRRTYVGTLDCEEARSLMMDSARELRKAIKEG